MAILTDDIFSVTQSKSQIPVRNQSKGKVMKTHQEDPDGGSVLQR